LQLRERLRKGDPQVTVGIHLGEIFSWCHETTHLITECLTERVTVVRHGGDIKESIEGAFGLGR
jgi:hypothetical protein